MRKAIRPPDIKILREEEKRDTYLTEIMKMREKIIKELPSIMPGEPAVHFTAFRQMRIHIIRMISPGSDNDCCMPRIEKFKVYRSNGRLKNDKSLRFMIEKPITVAARI